LRINRQKKKKLRFLAPIRLLLRLAVMGIGLGIIMGTSIRMFSPNDNIFSTDKDTLYTFKSKNGVKKSLLKILNLRAKILKVKSAIQPKEIRALSNRWKDLASKYPDIEASAFLIFLDNRNYAELYPNIKLPAASSIKAPILLIVLMMLDEGSIEWNEELKLTQEVIGGGAGWMSLKPLGTTFPLHEVATEMIRGSDNTATNLLVKRIGGKEVLNSRLLSLGLKATVVQNWLPDLKGTNTTSTKDLTSAISIAEKGEILSQHSRDLFREIMGSSRNNRLLPTGLLRGGLGDEQSDPDYALQIKGYRVYNKTGDIGIAYADAGLIQLPNNTRAIAGFIVRGPFNDPRSPELIRDFAAAMVPSLKPRPPLKESLLDSY